MHGGDGTVGTGGGVLGRGCVYAGRGREHGGRAKRFSGVGGTMARATGGGLGCWRGGLGWCSKRAGGGNISFEKGFEVLSRGRGNRVSSIDRFIENESRNVGGSSIGGFLHRLFPL